MESADVRHGRLELPAFSFGLGDLIKNCLHSAQRVSEASCTKREFHSSRSGPQELRKGCIVFVLATGLFSRKAHEAEARD